MRVVGVDLGSKRIGISTSDASGVLASPHSVIQRGGSRQADHLAIKAIVDEYEAEALVVGLPVSMNGQLLAAAQLVLAEVEQIAVVVGVPVETFDERKSTVTADELLMQNNLNAQERRKIIDKVAATVILQGWLDRRREQDKSGLLND
jgi:putative Holliday junction resolvase